MFGLDVLVEMVLFGKIIKVLVYFLAARVHRRPVKLWLERPSVVVGWDVTRTSE